MQLSSDYGQSLILKLHNLAFCSILKNIFETYDYINLYGKIKGPSFRYISTSKEYLQQINIYYSCGKLRLIPEKYNLQIT